MELRKGLNEYMDRIRAKNEVRRELAKRYDLKPKKELKQKLYKKPKLSNTFLTLSIICWRTNKSAGK